MSALVNAVSPAIAALARGLIRGYQLLLSPVLPACCRFSPSCSHYALEAVARFGPGRGGWLALKRLARCHPWSDGGEDPVPEAGGQHPGGPSQVGILTGKSMR